jgi:predicted neutral ceramidase superfamily lipid hydrolase
MLKDLIANFYELWGAAYLGNFSDQMFNNDLYFSVALFSIIISTILTIAYYYVVDRPGTAKFSIWSLNLLVGAIINFIIAFVSANNDLTEIFASIGEEVPTSFTSDMMVFSIINSMWTVLFMFLVSMLIKWKSTNSSYVPF